MHENSVIEINLAAVTHNMRLLRRIVGAECRVCPLIKAGGYGLGAVRVARTLLAAGADMLAVYSPAEAAELIRRAVDGRLLVLMPVREIDRAEELYRGLVCGRLELTVHDGDQLAAIIRIAERFGAAVPIHLEVDTGMSRAGCPLAEAPELLRTIAAHRRLRLAGLFTHFADAEANVPFTDQQLDRFNALIESERDSIPAECVIHAASTFATLRAVRYHKSLVRIGLGWAGYGLESLEGGEVLQEAEELQPAVTWTSRIVQLRSIPKGATVGYGARWTAPRESIIGLIPAGYADGFPVHGGATDETPNAAQVAVLLKQEERVSRAFVPVVGAVNMDQITVDLTECMQRHGESAPIGVGTEVELITPDAAAPNHVPRLAEIGGTFSHELLSRLHPRLKRVYRALPQEIVTPVAAPRVVVG